MLSGMARRLVVRLGISLQPDRQLGHSAGPSQTAFASAENGWAWQDAHPAAWILCWGAWPGDCLLTALAPLMHCSLTTQHRLHPSPGLWPLLVVPPNIKHGMPAGTCQQRQRR